MMQQIGKFIAGVCAVLFIVSGVAAITLFNIERRAFSAETYKTAIREEGLYESAPALLTDLILSSAGEPGSSTLFSFLNEGEMELVISSLLPPDELETLMNEVFDSFFAYLDGETDSITISLLPFKSHLTGEGGMQAFTQVMNAQPECTAEQALQIAMGLLGATEDLLICRPPQEVMGLIAPLVESQIQSMASSFPDEVTLAGSRLAGMSEFRTRLDRLRAAMLLTPVFPVLFLLGVAIFAVRSLDDWLKWWGIPFVVTGLSSALLALIGSPLIRLFVQTVVLQGNENMPPIILDMMRNVAGSVVRLILRPILVEGVILALLGAGMVYGAMYLLRKS